MADTERTIVERYDFGTSGIVRRISWGAILAGVTVALVTQLALSLLGLGIGMSAVDPLQERRPMAGFGAGAAIWWVVSTLIALFLGGWVAGRLAGIPRRLDATLHGILTWGVATLFTVYLLGSAVGGLVGGALGILGQGTSAALQGASESAAARAGRGGGAERVGEQAQQSWEAIRRESQELLARAGIETGQQAPGRQETRRGTVGRRGEAQAQPRVPPAVRDPRAADELRSILERMNTTQGRLDPEERQRAVDILVTQGNMSRQEAETTVARWERQTREATAGGARIDPRAEQQIREAADKAASATARASLWGFLGLVLSAIAAAIGGRTAVPRDVVATARA